MEEEGDQEVQEERESGQAVCLAVSRDEYRCPWGSRRRQTVSLGDDGGSQPQGRRKECGDGRPVVYQ